MSFVDLVTIKVKSGNGGDGAVSFRREKYVPKGGPDGGDGGRGGDVRIVVSPSVHGLAAYRGQKDFKAENGERGGRNRRHGRDGEELRLFVPPGTKITDISDPAKPRLIADLTDSGQDCLIARGGSGGRGNWHFRGPQNQTPREFEPGKAGQELALELEMVLIAQVGIIGMPNAGKSTLLSVITNARPKIAAYPFTTLEPNLGVAEIDGQPMVIADIPGLIAGAAEGKGLGHDFLRHSQRTRLLVHLIDAGSERVLDDYRAIRNELGAFDRALLDKPEIIVLSKIDLNPDWQKRHKLFIAKYKAIGISAATGEGVKELRRAIGNDFRQLNRPAESVVTAPDQV